MKALTTLKPAWYTIDGHDSLADFLNLLHPPYTLWHLSYVLLGISVAPHIFLDRSIAVMLAFFLGLGIGAHALDETMGNPLRTRLSKRQLFVIGISSLAVAAIIGLYYVLLLSVLILPFVFAELFFAFAYNLEMFEKRFHNTLVFALSWGVIPLLTGYYVNALSISLQAILIAVVAGLLTVVQRTLSAQARNLRRKTKPIQALELETGERIPTSSSEIARPAELSLKILTLTIFLLAVAMALAKILA